RGGGAMKWGSHTDATSYRAPLSCVRVSATVTETVDRVLGTSPRAPEATVALEVIGGELLEASIDSDWLRDTSVGFSMTDDGVLVSSSVDATGEAGKVVLGVVSIGATAAATLGGGPVAGGVFAAAAGAWHKM